MKVLVVCDRYPASMQDGLVLRLRHFVKALQGRHSFDLLCLDRGVDVADAGLAPLFGRIVRVPWPAASDPPAGRLRKLLDATTNYPRSAAFSRELEQMLQAQRYDVVCDSAANMFNTTLPVLRRHPLPLVADQVDDSHVRLRRELQQATTQRRRASLMLHLSQERQWARGHIAQAHTVVLATDGDAASFRQAAPQAHTATVGNGVDLDYFAPLPAGQTQPAEFDLVFEGAMDFAPNIDTAVRLVRDVLPLLRQSQPRARVLLVGRNPVAAVQALAGPDVHVTGTVPDVRAWLHRARVFVCPMQLGAGIKNKLLQAWALGLPVVATRNAAEGLQARDGDNLLLRESAADIATAVSGLLADPGAARRLGDAGRATAEARHGWDSRAREFEAVLQAAAASAVVSGTR